jgi:hypothetical protein
MRKDDKRENIVVSPRRHFATSTTRILSLHVYAAYRQRTLDIRESRLARNTLPDLRDCHTAVSTARQVS